MSDFDDFHEQQDRAEEQDIRFDFDELHDPMEDKRIAQNRARTELPETDPNFLPPDADE